LWSGSTTNQDGTASKLTRGITYRNFLSGLPPMLGAKMYPGGRGWKQRHPDISNRKRHRVCSELLVLGDGITRSAAAETGHLRERAGLREGRTLVGTHNYTSFRQHPAPSVSPVRVRDCTSSAYPTPIPANATGQTRTPDCFETPGQWGKIGTSAVVRRQRFGDSRAERWQPEVGEAAPIDLSGRCRRVRRRSKLRASGRGARR
jgi:hypothetical protein